MHIGSSVFSVDFEISFSSQAHHLCPQNCAILDDIFFVFLFSYLFCVVILQVVGITHPSIREVKKLLAFKNMRSNYNYPLKLKTREQTLMTAPYHKQKRHRHEPFFVS